MVNRSFADMRRTPVSPASCRAFFWLRTHAYLQKTGFFQGDFIRSALTGLVADVIGDVIGDAIGRRNSDLVATQLPTQWHDAMARRNGTTQWHDAIARHVTACSESPSNDF